MLLSFIDIVLTVVAITTTVEATTTTPTTTTQGKSSRIQHGIVLPGATRAEIETKHVTVLICIDVKDLTKLF